MNVGDGVHDATSKAGQKVYNKVHKAINKLPAANTESKGEVVAQETATDRTYYYRTKEKDIPFFKLIFTPE